MYGAGEILVGHQKGRVAARAIAVIACLPVIAGTCIALKGAASHQTSIAASSLLSLRLRPIDLLTKYHHCLPPGRRRRPQQVPAPAAGR